MPRIAGITTKKNDRGKITHVTINLQKHWQTIAPLLQQLGVIEKTLFQQECENGFTIEEARAKSHKHIENLWRKNTAHLIAVTNLINTTWYITFDKEANVYLIKKIINNHSKEYPAFMAGL